MTQVLRNAGLSTRKPNVLTSQETKSAVELSSRPSLVCGGLVESKTRDVARPGGDVVDESSPDAHEDDGDDSLGPMFSPTGTTRSGDVNANSMRSSAGQAPGDGEKPQAKRPPRASSAGGLRKAMSKAVLLPSAAHQAAHAGVTVVNPMGTTAGNPLRPSLHHTRASGMSGKGIPVREGLQAVYKVYRDKSIKEGVLFVAMFAFFLINVNLVNDVSTEFHTSAMFESQFLQQELSSYATWQKTFADVWTYGDIFQWLTDILYPNVYSPSVWPMNPAGPEDGVIPNISMASLGPQDPNSTFPLLAGSFQVLGGVRMRQVRVSRDSCIERRSVGQYSVPAAIFNQSVVYDHARVGAQGASVLQYINGGNVNTVPPDGHSPSTGHVSDGGPSASRAFAYTLGCMNYWALTHTCPSDADVSGLTPTVLINTIPSADRDLSTAGAVVPVTVTLSGRVKCAMHNITSTLAQSIYSSYNPLSNGSFATSVTPAGTGYVDACMGRFVSCFDRKAILLWWCVRGTIRCGPTPRHRYTARSRRQMCHTGRFSLQDTLDNTCTDEYSSSVEQTSPFVGETGTVYYYTPGASRDVLFGMLGWGPSFGYGTGGYVTHLSNDPDHAASMLAQLVWDHWINKGTRAVTVDFNAWNANTRMGTTVRFVFELFSSGYMTKYSRVYTFRVLDHDPVANLLIYVMCGGFVAFWLYFIYKEIQRAWHSYNLFAYASSFRNMYMLLLLSLAGVYIWSWMEYMFVVDMYSRLVSNYNTRGYVDLFDMGERFQTMFTLSGVYGLICCFKLFEYMGLNKRMRTIWLTLYEARKDLLAFLLGFLLLVFGFSVAGHFIFGYSSPGFHTPSSSMSTLLRFPLGDFDYQGQLYDTRPALAPWFFVRLVMDW